jgi:hypothetical protein
MHGTKSPLSQYVFMEWCLIKHENVFMAWFLLKHRDVFTFTSPWEFKDSATASRPALGHTQPPVQWVPGVKWPGRESDHSPPSTSESTWSYTSILHTPSRRGAYLSTETTLPYLEIAHGHFQSLIYLLLMVVLFHSAFL